MCTARSGERTVTRGLWVGGMTEAQGAYDGAVLFILIVAGVLTCVLGVVALMLLRRAILHNMGASSGQPVGALPEVPRRAAAAPLTAVIDTGQADTGLSDHILLRVAAAHLAAGLAYATLAAIILLTMSGLELFPLGTAIVIWSLAWPTVMVLSLLIGPDRGMQGLIVLGYIGGLLVFGILTWAVGTPALEFAGLVVPGMFQPFIIWLCTPHRRFFFCSSSIELSVQSVRSCCCSCSCCSLAPRSPSAFWQFRASSMPPREPA